MKTQSEFVKLSNRCFVFSASAFPSAISFMLIFFISVEHLPIPIQAQIIPLTSLLSLAFLPFVLRWRIYVTPLLKIVALFIGFILLHSVIVLLIDLFNGAGQIRVIAWGRQVFAIILGVSVFLVLRKTLKSVSDRFIVQSIIIGALPPLFIALLNALWGFAGSTPSGMVVVHIRSILGLRSWPYRASGLSMEPAHFAFYIVMVVIPALFIEIITSKRKFFWFIFLTGSITLLMGTFSTTGFIELLSLFLTWAFLNKSNKRYYFFNLIFVTLVFVVVLAMIYLFPDNYAVMQMKSLFYGGNKTVSVIDRFYGTVGPFMRIFSSYTLLGYGLGGTSIHFHEIMPENVQTIIESVHWRAMPNLSSLVGRVFAETGLFGLLLFGMVFYESRKEIKILAQDSKINSALISMMLPVLVAFLVGSTIGGNASFALPYLWLWLAVIDSRYIRQKRRCSCEC